MLRPAVFIDRDGTMNVDAGYINSPERFVMYPFTAQAVRMLNFMGYLAVVVTNQSGVGRGVYSLEVMHATNKKFTDSLAANGAKIDGLYYCPHDPHSNIPEFKRDCDCRKPRTGMLEQAVKELPIDRARTFFIGDKLLDMQAGWNFGSKTILVRTGYGLGEYTQFAKDWKKQPDYYCENLLEAVNIIRAES